MEIKKDEGYRTRSMTIDKTENLINFNIRSVLKMMHLDISMVFLL